MLQSILYWFLVKYNLQFGLVRGMKEGGGGIRTHIDTLCRRTRSRFGSFTSPPPHHKKEYRRQSFKQLAVCGHQINAKRTKMDTKVSAIVLMSFTRTWRAGPAVSLNGSPTVSPTTAAL